MAWRIVARGEQRLHLEEIALAIFGLERSAALHDVFEMTGFKLSNVHAPS
jgi:hypothetical protein